MILYALCNLMKSYMIDVLLSKVRSAHSPEFTHAKPYQVVFCNSTIKISRDNSLSKAQHTSALDPPTPRIPTFIS